MKIKKVTAFCFMLFLSLTTLSVINTATTHAVVGNCTWTGGAGDGDFDNKDNWAADCDASGVPDEGVPEDNDSLIFDNTGATQNINVINNIDNLIISDITFSGNTNYAFDVSGNSVTMAAAAEIKNSSTGDVVINFSTITTNNDLTINADTDFIGVDSEINGTGTLDKIGAGIAWLAGNNTYSGATTIASGELLLKSASGLGASTSGTLVAATSTLTITVPGDGITIAEPITLADAGMPSRKTLEVTRGSGNPSEIIFSGAITLSSGPFIEVGSDRPLKITGVVGGLNGFDFEDISTDGSGSLSLTANNTYTGIATFYDTVIINGQQGGSNIVIASGGTLKGTGTVGDITINTSGRVAPGLSPGCLIVGNTVIAGSFDVEIGGTTACTEYDQLQVTGTVDVTGGTLNLSRWNNFTPAVGQTYTIISNDAADAITGTFTGLAQGATVTVDGYSMTISYTGGDGNDVVLTVTGVPATPPTVPGTPNTGFGLLFANPLLTLIASTAAAAGLYIAARRYGFATAKIRR